MKLNVTIVGGFAALFAASVALPVMAQEKKAEEKKTEPAKAKAEKVAGDIGLLDTEKNYMIVVTKEGKLVTLDFNAKTKADGNQRDKGKNGGRWFGIFRDCRVYHKGREEFSQQDDVCSG